jgi:Rap guanine nucleotide exchange factor 4
MLEHLLETINLLGPTDPFLDDFLLTHIVFMPIGKLIDELANYYHSDTESENEDYEYSITCKKKVVHFIQKWVAAIRHVVFDDPAVTHFIEVNI